MPATIYMFPTKKTKKTPIKFGGFGNLYKHTHSHRPSPHINLRTRAGDNLPVFPETPHGGFLRIAPKCHLVCGMGIFATAKHPSRHHLRQAQPRRGAGH